MSTPVGQSRLQPLQLTHRSSASFTASSACSSQVPAWLGNALSSALTLLVKEVDCSQVSPWWRPLPLPLPGAGRMPSWPDSASRSVLARPRVSASRRA